MGVGRSTIREAISSLVIRGYVRRVHGRGVQSIDRSIEAVSNSISDMLMRNDFKYTDVLQFRSVRYKTYLDADFSFHEEVIKATQNRMLLALITSYSKVIRYAIEVSTDEDYRPERHYKYHEKLLNKWLP